MKKARIDCDDETRTMPLDVTEEEIHLCDYLYGATEVPKGFRTKKEWMQIWNLRPRATAERLTALVDLGKLEKQTFRAYDASRRYCPKPYWRIKK